VSSGPRAALPIVAGFPQCHHRQPGVGFYRHPERALGGVTGPTRQCLDREVDPVAASGTGIPPPTRSICRRCAVRSEGVQRGEPSGQPSPDRRCGQEQTRSSDR
jgi:hypothetical protein